MRVVRVWLRRNEAQYQLNILSNGLPQEKKCGEFFCGYDLKAYEDQHFSVG